MGEHEKFTLTRMTVDGVDIPLGDMVLRDIDFSMAVDAYPMSMFPIENLVGIEIPLKVIPHYPEWHFFMAAFFGERLSNNFLKMHGYPMRRKRRRR